MSRSPALTLRNAEPYSFSNSSSGSKEDSSPAVSRPPAELVPLDPEYPEPPDELLFMFPAVSVDCCPPPKPVLELSLPVSPAPVNLLTIDSPADLIASFAHCITPELVSVPASAPDSED